MRGPQKATDTSSSFMYNTKQKWICGDFVRKTLAKTALVLDNRRFAEQISVLSSTLSISDREYFQMSINHRLLVLITLMLYNSMRETHKTVARKRQTRVSCTIHLESDNIKQTDATAHTPATLKGRSVIAELKAPCRLHLNTHRRANGTAGISWQDTRKNSTCSWCHEFCSSTFRFFPQHFFRSQVENISKSQTNKHVNKSSRALSTLAIHNSREKHIEQSP